MTKTEGLLWFELKNKKLGERFLRQFSITKYVVDFYCPRLKLAIEIDGATHLTDDEILYDAKGRLRLNRCLYVLSDFKYGNI